MPETENPDTTARDYAMARLAAAESYARATLDAIREALDAFTEPDDDPKGKDRAEAIESALETAGCISSALEDCQGVLGAVDNEEGEPWDEDDEPEPEPLPKTKARRRR